MKSVTAKALLKRLRKLHKDIPYVEIDPKSKYTKVFRFFGVIPVEIEERKEGPDPISSFS